MVVWLSPETEGLLVKPELARQQLDAEVTAAPEGTGTGAGIGTGATVIGPSAEPTGVIGPVGTATATAIPALQR